ncbi:MAG: TetR family transcriptional regulator [Pseudomonadales bacterium]|nr:TetR/AcrR family transcriptional regulator [Pseudomonadales bacterium]NIX07921.1 TetR family transcriptional regulator [Pseudomonadales bacterium]
MSGTRSLTPAQAQRRAKILNAARDIVTCHGYDGMIMRDVAALANVSATTLYNLYNTKDELLLEALRDRIEASTEQARRRAPEPGYHYLLAHVESVCQETRRSPAYVNAIAQALFRSSPGDPLVEVLLARLQEDVERSLQAMSQAGHLHRDANIDQLGRALAGSFWSNFLLWNKGRLALKDLERAQLNGYLSLLIPASTGRAKGILQKRLLALNGLN